VSSLDVVSSATLRLGDRLTVTRPALAAREAFFERGPRTCGPVA
jgi:hypothetical protein